MPAQDSTPLWDNAVTPVLREGMQGAPAEGLVGQGQPPPQQRMTEVLLGSHAGQQGRCGLGVRELQEARESRCLAWRAGRSTN